MSDALARHVTRLADHRFSQHQRRRPADDGTGHRGLMVMIKNAICCYLAPLSRWRDDRQALTAARGWISALARLQDGSGLFSSSGNVASPPDSSFSLNDAAQTASLIRARVGADDDLGLAAVADALQQILDRATPSLVAGGVHTPNHRWELASALTRIDALRPDPAVRARISAWLDEGIDIDADGLYSERSANYAAYVSNPALLVMGDLLDRPHLLAVVHRNLHAQSDLTDADGLVETVFSRRQDQRLLDHRIDDDGFHVGAFLPQYRRFATAGCPQCLAMYGWVVRMELSSATPTVDQTTLLADLLSAEVPVPEGAGDPGTVGADGHRVREFTAAGVVVHRGARSMITVNAGSDVARAGRVGSGLACNPTVLRWRNGAVVLNSLRLSREFFGLGPFRADGLVRVTENSYRLEEEIVGSYYQPLDRDDCNDHGDYRLEFEDRFSAQMSFSERERTDVRLRTTLTVELADDTVRLTTEVQGPATDCCFELGFRPGGELSGAAALGADRWLLAGHADYRVGDSMIKISTTAVAGPAQAAVYNPGEAYTFVGGTDAVGGPRLYLPVTAPGSFELLLSAG